MCSNAMFGDKSLCQLVQCHITIRIDPSNHDIPISRQLATASRPALARWRQRSRLRLALRQTNGRRRAHPKSPRSTTPCATIRNRIVNTNTKISRMCFAHDPPPMRVNHKSRGTGIPRFRFSAIRSNRSGAPDQVRGDGWGWALGNGGCGADGDGCDGP